MGELLHCTLQNQGQVTPVSPGSRINATVTNSPKTPRTTPANDAPQSVYTQLDIRTRHEHNTYDTVGIEVSYDCHGNFLIR